MQLSRELTIINKRGMHARAAAKFVQLASTCACEIEVERKGQRVNGKSIMGVMMLAASKGSNITVYANGDDAEISINKIANLINTRFDEDD